MAARPSARLTAVVDLPTPPLPEATAMMCFTPGTSMRPPPPVVLAAGRLGRGRGAWPCACACGAAAAGRGTLGGHHGRRRQHARHGAHGLLAGLAQRLQGGAAGRVDIEGDRDMAAAYGDAAHHALRHDALCRRRIDDGLEDLADGRFGYFRHVWLVSAVLGNIVSPLDCGCCCRHIYAARPEIKADNPEQAAGGPEVNDGVEQQ